MPKFYVAESAVKKPIEVDFADFLQITKGLSISSLATSNDYGGFLEFGLSQTYNLRLQIGSDGDISASLVSTLNKGEQPPIRVEVISSDEQVTAELLERRLHALRQLYAVTLLIQDGREGEVRRVLEANPHADIESTLIKENDKLLIQEAGPGSLILTLISRSKRTYQAALGACALPYAEGRNALLRRVQADTDFKELTVKEKAQNMRISQAHAVLDIVKKMEAIKDKDTRELIRGALLGNSSLLNDSGNPLLALNSSEKSDPLQKQDQPKKR